MSLVDSIKAAAGDRHLTISELEKLAGLSENSIYRWDRTDPGHSKVVAVADALGISLDELRAEKRRK